MGMVMQFCPRQMLIGNVLTAATYYSEIFDSTPYAEIGLEFRAFTMSLTQGGVIVELETTTDPTLVNWTGLGELNLMVPGSLRGEYGDLLQFVRVRVRYGKETSAVVEVVGVARESA